MTTYDEAVAAAGRHRARFGDDVIQHYPTDEDWGFVCDDCGWVVTFDAGTDPYRFDMDDDGPVERVHLVEAPDQDEVEW